MKTDNKAIAERIAQYLADRGVLLSGGLLSAAVDAAMSEQEEHEMDALIEDAQTFAQDLTKGLAL